MVLFAAGSGIGPLLAIRRRWGTAELLTVPLGTSALLWAILGTILGRPPLHALMPWVPTVLAMLLVVVSRRRQSRIEIGLSPLDAAPLLAMVLAAIPIVAVFMHNGLHGDQYVAHSWFHLDSFYFFALAQESVERGGWPGENPFIAGVANYYPSFLHVGLGALASQGSRTVAVSIAWLAPFFLVASAGLWVAACIRAAEVRSHGAAVLASAVSLIGVGGAVALRPDLFIYPQSQAFALGWLALMIWLANAEPFDQAGMIAASAVAFALVLAHTVTGAAAIAFAAGTSVHLLLIRETRRQGLFIAVGTFALAFVFWRINTLPYSGPRAPFSLSLPGATSFLQPWLWPMVGLALFVGSSWRTPAQALPALCMLGLGAAYYLNGSALTDALERSFVSFNAERFLHLGLLLGLLPAVRGDRRIGLAGALLIAASAAWHPTDWLRNSRQLIAGPARVVDAAELEFLEQIRATLPADARILAPVPDFALPAFTGRTRSPIPVNMWGLGTLSAAEFDHRLRDALAFTSLPTVQWPAVLDRWRYTHVLLEDVVLPSGLDPASAARWLEQQLPAGEFAVQISAGDRFLLRRTAGSDADAHPAR